MATPAAWRNTYRRIIGMSPRRVKVRRYTGTGANRPFFDADVTARIRGYEPKELIGTIKQGDSDVLFLAEELDRHQFPSPVKIGDKIVLENGKELNVEAPDDNTRRTGELIAWKLQVRG